MLQVRYALGPSRLPIKLPTRLLAPTESYEQEVMHASVTARMAFSPRQMPSLPFATTTLTILLGNGHNDAMQRPPSAR